MQGPEASNLGCLGMGPKLSLPTLLTNNNFHLNQRPPRFSYLPPNYPIILIEMAQW